MRGVLLVALLAAAACAPKAPQTKAFDDDLAAPKAQQQAPESLAEPPTEARAEAPTAPGARTGTIDRAHLVAMLDKGPAEFLHQIEVAPHMDGQKFVGWQLVQLIDAHGALGGVDVVPGDVLLAVNGRQLVRPDQLMELWDSLRTANEVVAEVWRGRDKLELRFAIEPKL